jgi:hypothetical protein
MASKNWKGFPWKQEYGFTFAQMWGLIESGNTLDTRVEFSNELLIGLFWEEHAFQNWWQLKENGEPLKQYAAGFGQIERSTLGRINMLYAEKRNKYTPELIISDPQISVNATVDYLRYLRKTFKYSDKRMILHNYGGNENGGVTDVKKKASQWLACEGILRGARGEFTTEIITQALMAAEPNHAGFIKYVVGTGYRTANGNN